ncbi:tuftelin 1a [Clupea harengus]|uniref:Tuftelin 1a n=1 Tax=Clupea harengus TaxID=7950 RepID=A0A6P8FXL8_CLUHA|nr:tuftelin 1a [Clupea harengus]
MNGITRSLCTIEDIRSEERVENCRRLRLTLQDQSQQQNQSKPIGRAFAVVQPPTERESLKNEPIKPSEEKVEVIKVYLKARQQQQARHQQSLKMLSEEVSQIQEVRYCLKNLREQMAAKNHTYKVESKIRLSTTGSRDSNAHSSASASSVSSSSAAAAAAASATSSSSAAEQKHDDKQEWEDEQERVRMREVSKRLYAQLQDAEKKHQEDREKLQREAGQYKQQLTEQGERLREAELTAEQQDQRVTELQRLLTGIEQESSSLREELMTREAELMQLKEQREEGLEDERRSEDLQKENTVLKEKLHHLDDMLKSQQRKLRTMIEQVQNSKLVIQERDRVIRELEERVAFLEAENREMHDHMDYYMGGQRSNSYLSSDQNAQIVYSKPLRPSTQSNKSLPFIKVIEIKS